MGKQSDFDDQVKAIEGAVHGLGRPVTDEELSTILEEDTARIAPCQFVQGGLDPSFMRYLERQYRRDNP